MLTIHNYLQVFNLSIWTLAPWCCGNHYCITLFKKVWTQILRMLKSCSQRVGDSWWWRSLTMVPAGYKAKCLSLVNDTTKQFFIIINLCIYLYTYIYICMYIYIHTYIYMYIHIIYLYYIYYVCIHIYIYQFLIAVREWIASFISCDQIIYNIYIYI